MDPKKEWAEYQRIKRRDTRRNELYYLYRQAVRGNFRWPTNWPDHIDKRARNLCKKIVREASAHLMSRGFDWNINRPNSIEWREAAERTEKILRVLFKLSNADVQFYEGSRHASMLGRAVFKVYKDGEKGKRHACFSRCQPEHFHAYYADGDAFTGRLAKVFYSYPVDVLEAERRWGKRQYRTERELDDGQRYTPLTERQYHDDEAQRQRRVPVLEVWTADHYLLQVGGVTIHNDKNPFRWTKTGEGFIPFVVVENTTADGENEGESDLAEAVYLNEALNMLISRKGHMVKRWLDPTMIWEGAPQNYGQQLAQTKQGGGVLPVRLGGRITLLSHDRSNEAVMEDEQSLVQAAWESAGFTDAAMSGQLGGGWNTGPTGQLQWLPTEMTTEAKHNTWTRAIEQVAAMLLEVQENIGASEVLGEAVINQTRQSQDAMALPEGEAPAGYRDGETVTLSGEDIAGLREVSVHWPGMMPKDNLDKARFELEKMQQGVQSIHTTMEKLGEEFPSDELARIRQESHDPGLQPKTVAEQMRSAAPWAKMDQDAMLQQQQMAMQAQQGGPQQGGPPALPPGEPTSEEVFSQPKSLGGQLRELAKMARPRIDVEDEDMPVIESGLPAEGY